MASMSISGAYRSEPFVFKSTCCVRCGKWAVGCRIVEIKVPKRSSRITLNLPSCADHFKVLIGNWSALIATLGSVYLASFLVKGRLWRVLQLSSAELVGIEILQFLLVVLVWAFFAVFAIRVSIVGGRLQLNGVAEAFVQSAVVVEQQEDPTDEDFVNDWKNVN